MSKRNKSRMTKRRQQQQQQQPVIHATAETPRKPKVVAKPDSQTPGPDWKVVSRVFGGLVLVLTALAWNNLNGDLGELRKGTSARDTRVISLEVNMAAVKVDVENVKTGISDLKRSHESSAAKLDRVEALLIKLSAQADSSTDEQT